jgi:L-iditol 2-dehydrogenase
VIVGQYTDHGDATFRPHADLNRKHLEVRGCWGSDYAHFHRAVALVREPELAMPWSRITLDEYDLERAGEALAAVAAGAVVKALLIPRG